MDEFYARDAGNAAIVVMPDGTDGQWYDAIDGSLRNEEYVLRSLVPYVDRHYRTIADRRARAIDGLSNGGYGSMHLAAKAPDLFSVAGGMSSNLGGRDFNGWGNGVADPAYGHGQTPADLAGNLDHVDLMLDWGASCSSDLTVDLCARWAFEQSFRFDNQYFRDQLAAVGHKGALDYRETEGAHAWKWWTLWLRERHLPFILSRIRGSVAAAPSPIPVTFRYRSMASAFSVYGYSVAVTRDVREFLDLTDVRADGFTITGSGKAVVKTAPRYVPGAEYSVGVADRGGRLTIPVDLGPSHTAEQYGVQASLGERWTTRKVTIARVEAEAIARPVLPITGGAAPLALAGLLFLCGFATLHASQIRAERETMEGCSASTRRR